MVISTIKARQQELKRFFGVVGNQQVEILDQLALRDLSKMAKKAKAHKNVPEYDAIVESLDERMKDAQDLARTRYDIQMRHEEQRLQQEKEVIEQQYRVSLALLSVSNPLIVTDTCLRITKRTSCRGRRGHLTFRASLSCRP
jgi:hypothetical protein